MRSQGLGLKLLKKCIFAHEIFQYFKSLKKIAVILHEKGYMLLSTVVNADGYD